MFNICNNFFFGRYLRTRFTVYFFYFIFTTCTKHVIFLTESRTVTHRGGSEWKNIAKWNSNRAARKKIQNRKNHQERKKKKCDEKESGRDENKKESCYQEAMVNKNKRAFDERFQCTYSTKYTHHNFPLNGVYIKRLHIKYETLPAEALLPRPNWIEVKKRKKTK